MDKVSKKEIRNFVEDTLGKVLLKFAVSIPSNKKIEKLTRTFSKKYAEELTRILKKKKTKDVEKHLKTSKKTVKKTVSKDIQTL